MKEFIEAVIRSAGAEVKSRFLTAEVQYKDGAENTVTDADIASEELITKAILERYPDHLILGEEAHQEVSLTAPKLWIIDPLDGTNNFASGFPHFSISIAYVEAGVVMAGAVYDPSRDELFSAVRGAGATLNGQPLAVATRKTLGESLICTGFYYDRGAMMERTLEAIKSLFHEGIRGLRRTGSAALDMAYTAAGRFDGFFEYELKPWDFAAGLLLLEEAGGVGSDIDGGVMSVEARGLIVGQPTIFPHFQETVRWVTPE